VACGCGEYNYCAGQCYLCSCQQTCYNESDGDVGAYATCAAACPANSIFPEGQDLTDIIYSGESSTWPGVSFDFFGQITSCTPDLHTCIDGCAGDYSSCDTTYATCVDAADGVYIACLGGCGATPGCADACADAHDAALASCYSSRQSCYLPVVEGEISCKRSCIDSNSDEIQLALKGTGADCAQTNCYGESIGAEGDSMAQCFLDAIDNSVTLAWTAVGTYADDVAACEGSYATCASACTEFDGDCFDDCLQTKWGCVKEARASWLEDLSPTLGAMYTQEEDCLRTWLCSKVAGEKPKACFCDHLAEIKADDWACNVSQLTAEASLQRCIGNCPPNGFAFDYLGDGITCLGLCNVEAMKGNFADAEAGRISARTQDCKRYFPESANHQMRGACKKYCTELDTACDNAFAIATASCITTCCDDAGCIADCASAWEVGLTDCETPLNTCLDALVVDDVVQDNIVGLYTCLTDFSTCVLGGTICNEADCNSACDAHFPDEDCPDCGEEGRLTSDDVYCLPTSYNDDCPTAPSVSDYTCD
jgi:hypothetical protein